MNYDPNLKPTPELIEAVRVIKEFAARFDPTASDNWQIFGLTPVSNIRSLEQEVKDLKELLSTRDSSTNTSFTDARAQAYSVQFGSKIDIKRQLGIK